MRMFQVALCENYYTQNSLENFIELAWEWKASPVTQSKDLAHFLHEYSLLQAADNPGMMIWEVHT